MKAIMKHVEEGLVLIELADKGTLFLDEIGEISFSLQAKLLRVLQEQQIVRLGDKRVISVDVRIVAATNQDLPIAVAEKRFREDLFYRLCVLPLAIPPLRLCREDIMDLVRFYMDRSEIEEYKWGKDCTELLTSYTWPGNIRELKSFVKRLKILHPEAPITREELGEILLPLKGYTQEETKEAELPEKERILKTLKECGGNRTMAAKKLGMDRSTLWRKLKE